MCAAALILCVWGQGAHALEVTFRPVQDAALEPALRASSLLVEVAEQTPAAGAIDILSAAGADYARLLGVLYAGGYFGARVGITLDGLEAASIAALPRAAVHRAVIDIDTGPLFVFGALDIAHLHPSSMLPDEFQAGAIADVAVLRDAAQIAVTAWQDNGHAKARIASQDLVARHGSAQLDVDVNIAPGPVLTFGALKVVGNEAVRTRRVRQIAGLPTGRIYSPEEQELAETRLRRTGAFQSVSLTQAAKTGPQDSLDIIAAVSEAKPRRFGFGAEVSSTEGATLSGYWLHRNLLGGAERLRVEGEIKGIAGDTGGEDYRISGNFERPATGNEDTNFYANMTIEKLNEASFASKQVTIEAGFERIASQKRRYRLGLGLRRGFVTDSFGTSDYALLLMPLGLTFEYKDRPLDAQKGYFAAFDFAPFTSISGGDGGLLSTADLRGYHSFNPRLTLALRGQVGSLVGPDLANAPADFLFFSGGGGTVRGHGYQSLGVDLGGGNISGGRAFMAVSGEVRIRTASKFGAVGFFDAGYIGSEAFPDGSGVWHSGAGAGLRYDTGIGPLRLDVAVPVSGPKTSNFEIYVGIGQSF